jgi:hypothetical protein
LLNNLLAPGYSTHDSIFHTRPLADRRRQRCARFFPPFARARPAWRALGLQPFLAGRTPRHAGHRERRHGGADRLCRGRHLDHPRRRRRHHAAEPLAARHCRAVRHARIAVPGRIDLGLGRAPGSDHITARALRRNLSSDADEFPQDVLELQDYFADSPRRQVRAVPGAGLEVPLWILGSSLFGAQLAAHLGLPYAFASHFAPQMMMQAIDLYRANFKPSAQLDKPYVMLGFNVFAADTDEEAQFRATSMQQAFVNLRSGRPTKLQPPVRGYLEALPRRNVRCSTACCRVRRSARRTPWRRK